MLLPLATSAAERATLRQSLEGLREVLRYTNSHKQIAETSLHQAKQRLAHLEEQLVATRRMLDEARATARADAESVRLRVQCLLFVFLC